MARVVYSLSGEGRGHATRVRTVVDELARRHRVTVLAPGDAWPLLDAAYRGSEAVEVRPLPGLRFHYDGHRRLALGPTLGHGLLYLAALSRHLGAVRRLLERLEPDLAVVDFEPLLPRAARAAGVPYVSLDHQHFLCYADLSSLPPALQRHARLMALVVRRYCSGQRHAIVSSFYAPPLKPGLAGVTQVGVLLRAPVRQARPETGDHLVGYLRRFAPPALLDALAACGREVRLYGLGGRPPRGSLRFEAISEERFVADLASAGGLISTAGNQLVGEALTLGKPVLALPEAGNHEQQINAHFLEASGAGLSAPLEGVGCRELASFLERLDELAAAARRVEADGTAAALAELERQLAGAAGTFASRRPAVTGGGALTPVLSALEG